MNTRRCDGRQATARVFHNRYRWVCCALVAYGAAPAGAQTVGPGTINATVVNNAGTGDQTVVGNTTIAIGGTGTGTAVTAGTLTLDPNASGFPAGPIAVQTTSGHGLFVNASAAAAAIIAQPNVTVSTTLGSGAVALGSAASITASGLTINNGAGGTTGGGYGAVAQDGGQIRLTNSAITVTNTSAIALGTAGAGSSLTLSGTNTIVSNGARGVGIYAKNGGSFTLPANTVLNMNGQGSAGVVLEAAPQADAAVGDGLTIHLTGTGATNANGSTGVAAFGGSTATFRGLVVDGADASTGVHVVSGDPRGLGISNAGTSSTVNLSDATITVSRSSGSVYTVTSTPSVALVTAVGGSTPSLSSLVSAAPAGLRASPGVQSTLQSTSTINATNTTINVSATNGYGVYAGARAVSGLNTIALTNSSVNGNGSSVNGLGADQNGLVTATGSTVNVAGGGSALYLITGADVTGGVGPTIALTDTQVRTSGNSAGIVSQNFSNTLVNRVSMTGGTMNVPDSVAIYATGGPTSVTASNTAVSGGRLLQALGSTFAPQATVVDVTASNGSVLDGDAFANATAVANIALQSGSRWSGAALNVTNVSVDASSTWNVTGNSTVTQQVSNAGLVGFAAPTAGAFKTLTTQQYAGNGGVLGVNAYLGSDGSASDKLVINGGTASGTSGIRVTNAGGPGALTTQNGILVVDVANGGTTNAGSFTQSGRAVAGVYEYRLFRGAADGTNPDAWYLRSERAEPPPPPPVPPGPNPNVVVPLFRPEVGAYLANQRLAAGFLVHSLHDRLGEPQWTEQQTFDNDDARRGAGWVRLVGKDVGSRTSNGTFDVNSTAWMLQLGGDVAQWSIFRGDDRLHLGGMLGYSWGSSTGRATGNPFKADSDVQGVNVGVYGTWFQNDQSRLGWYTDLWAQFGWFTNHVNGEFLPSARYHSRVLALSAEGGYAWLPRFTRDWVIEPQAQVIYVRGYQDAFTEPTGTQVGGADSDGVITRLGVRMHRTWIDGKGYRYQPYLTLNWWHDSVDNRVALNGVGMSDLYPSNRYEVKLGFDLQGRRGWTGWSNVGWQWGSQSYHAFIGRVGVKYAW